MPDRNHEGYREYLKGAGRPVVTDEERLRARELRAKGMKLADIAKELGRVPSTIHNILKERHVQRTSGQR